jgi:hypothetical protein
MVVSGAGWVERRRCAGHNERFERASLLAHLTGITMAMA